MRLLHDKPNLPTPVSTTKNWYRFWPLGYDQKCSICSFLINLRNDFYMKSTRLLGFLKTANVSSARWELGSFDAGLHSTWCRSISNLKGKCQAILHAGIYNSLAILDATFLRKPSLHYFILFCHTSCSTLPSGYNKFSSDIPVSICASNSDALPPYIHITQFAHKIYKLFTQ